MWTGDDVQDLIWLMLYTGYRISDATLFDMMRLQDNNIFIRAKKNGGDVFAYVPDWLRDRLHAPRRALRAATVRHQVRAARDRHECVAPTPRARVRASR